ncbi:MULTISPECIES: peptide MFS transporter [unclassified Curtobacterium]|uniref:peptide MFS transporter n=1 Tax=unclassified Curtobacterium TaxID=257496 RepID=UPI000F4736C4|nr:MULTISPECIES: peptide MFS transporter [unclassified Curtobacterium]ROQ07731.1 POT family proton-dependent oligopeptide transporter [Curtobacterium sp. PhB171]ROQ23658.1 POT family proton-dependent oligopeptide transporter [Curtobacterium sp. PhB170]ROS35572.1 POT family proton-dependent oligopeptide transporter [Curtobacterium sp. PhB131]ROS69681.1 POT family proton-dependent oligopeptide transporter [Curtobacterium sp. PhB141]
MSGSTTGHDPQPKRTFFGQPFELSTPFAVELWERFSFYGMQGIVLIYMYYTVTQGGLGIDKGIATGIMGAYGGAVYLFTIIGAWIADRLLGADRTLFGSAIVVMLGHIALALIPGVAGVGVGLVLIALGSGGLKATATTIVGGLYSRDDPRRDAGFSLYYLGVNLGAFFGPLLTGLLQSSLGFHYGFGLAAVGMAAGLVQYAIRRKNLPDTVRHVTNPVDRRRLPLIGVGVVVALIVIAVAVLTGLLNVGNLPTVVVAIVILATIGYFVVILTSGITAQERSRVFAFIPLFIGSAVFWSLYQQQFTVVTVYSDERLNRSLFGWEMPVSWVQSINPVFIIVLSGVFAALWTKLGDRQPSTPTKFGLGTGIMGVAFLLFLPFVGSGQNGTPLLALVGILLVFTLAELLLSPVGQSVATKLAPPKFQTQMVALFFLSVSLGTAVTGVLSQYYDPANEAPYFAVLGLVAVAVGVVLLVLAKPVLRLMRGIR